jgi:hypothetical protein
VAQVLRLLVHKAQVVVDRAVFTSQPFTSPQTRPSLLEEGAQLRPPYKQAEAQVPQASSKAWHTNLVAAADQAYSSAQTLLEV